MASDQAITQLVTGGLENTPNFRGRQVAVPTQIGDGLAGPRNIQHLQIQRDAIPIAADELAFQRSLGMEVIARHRAGRYFFINPDFQVGGPGLDGSLPGLPLQGGLPGPSPMSPLQRGAGRTGTRGAQVIPPARTVYYTATPQVGYNVGPDW